VKRNISRTVKGKEQQQRVMLLDFETLQKIKIFAYLASRPQRPVVVRNDVTTKKVVNGLFQNLQLTARRLDY